MDEIWLVQSDRKLLSEPQKALVRICLQPHHLDALGCVNCIGPANAAGLNNVAPEPLGR